MTNNMGKDAVARGHGLYALGRAGRIKSRAVANGSEMVKMSVQSTELATGAVPDGAEYDLTIGMKNGQFVGGTCSCPHFLEMNTRHAMGERGVPLLRGKVICKHLAWGCYHLTNGAPKTGPVGIDKAPQRKTWSDVKAKLTDSTLGLMGLSR